MRGYEANVDEVRVVVRIEGFGVIQVAAIQPMVAERVALCLIVDRAPRVRDEGASEGILVAASVRGRQTDLPAVYPATNILV
jgi:N-acetylglutamate synthase-like GNAT family acetyltransferase